MPGSPGSPHQLIPVYNPDSGVTPHSLLTWLAQCEDLFKIFGSRNANSPLSIPDQIRIMGHAIKEPRMKQWWMQGRDKYVEMAMDDWIGAIKEQWLPTSDVTDTTRICFHLKQGNRDFKPYATELSYHRNIAGDSIIPEITYKHLLLFSAHPVLMFDVLAIPEFDVSATEPTANKLESIMSVQWDAIVSTGRHNPLPQWLFTGSSILLILLWVIILWMLSSARGAGRAAHLIQVLLILAVLLFILSWIRAVCTPPALPKPDAAPLQETPAPSEEPSPLAPKLIWCIGFWVLVWATTLYILSALWAGGRRWRQ